MNAKPLAKKRRTTIMAIPFLAAFLVAALLPPDAWSFSPVYHPTHPKNHPSSRLQQKHAPHDRFSLGVASNQPFPFRGGNNTTTDLGAGMRETSISYETEEELHSPTKTTLFDTDTIDESLTFASHDTFEALAPKDILLHFLSDDTSSSPLVLTPRNEREIPGVSSLEGSAKYLLDFLVANEAWVEEQIVDYGAVVFRGFGPEEHDSDYSVRTETALLGRELLRALDPGWKTESNNNSNEEGIARKRFEYYQVSDVAPNAGPRSLAGLNEPKHLLETDVHARLTDWREIFDDMPQQLRNKLEEKQLLYTRTSLAPRTEIPFPFRIRRRMDDDDYDDDELEESPVFQLFGSTNEKILERAYQQIVESLPDTHKKPAIERTFISGAFQYHPETFEKIWFGLAHTFHWTSLPAENLAHAWRSRNPLAVVGALRKAVAAFWRRFFLKSKKPDESTTVSFGDGSPLSWWDMHRIRRTIDRNTAQYAWKPGDLLVVDGLSMGLQR